jgi:hypothetical protein
LLKLVYSTVLASLLYTLVVSVAFSGLFCTTEGACALA